MTTSKHSRRTVLQLLLAGSVVSMTTGCETLQSLGLKPAGANTDGSELANRVQLALRKHPYTSQIRVSVSSDGDVVILKGLVNSESDIANLEIVAGQVEGVRHAQVDAYVSKP